MGRVVGVNLNRPGYPPQEEGGYQSTKNVDKHVLRKWCLAQLRQTKSVTAQAFIVAHTTHPFALLVEIYFIKQELIINESIDCFLDFRA